MVESITVLIRQLATLIESVKTEQQGWVAAVGIVAVTVVVIVSIVAASSLIESYTTRNTLDKTKALLEAIKKESK